ncbi:DUF2281 domain-containing protein [Pleurocapsa sp. FMAR1]|uniref:DUF2281 domain-containing protein n=1 Tax=Pleurocapsa sp. FMAR1 TaxID=3040204 RepID=UPI0029C8F21B|nr:DUF2281 domain-containing protein [Pleurocapsa sp. FMAR1]
MIIDEEVDSLIMNTEEKVIKKLKRFSLETQQEVLQFMEFLEFRNQSLKKKTDISALEAAGTLVGCLEAAEDLSTNKDYLKGFGQ